MSETTVDEDQVRAEHLYEVRQGVQWALLASVLGGGTIMMLSLIAVLGALSAP